MTASESRATTAVDELEVIAFYIAEWFKSITRSLLIAIVANLNVYL